MNVKQSQELREKIAEKTKAMGGLLEKVATESRAYSEDESKQKETLKKEIQDLEAHAEDAEFIESRAQVDAGADTAQKVASVAGGNPTGGSERRARRGIAASEGREGRREGRAREGAAGTTNSTTPASDASNPKSLAGSD